MIGAEARASAAAALSSGGGARPDNVCACILLDGELTLLVPSLSIAIEISVSAPTFRNSSDRDGVPTGITRVITEPSLGAGFAAVADSTRSSGGAVKSPDTVAPRASTSSFDGVTEAVEPIVESDVRSGPRAGGGVALPGALGLVVDGSAIEGASRVERT